MKKKKLVIWGASGHALVVADIIRLNDEYEIVGFLDDFNPEHYNMDFCGAPILGGKEKLKDLRRMGVKNIIFGFGDCKARLRLSDVVLKEGFFLINAIHPKAVVAEDTKIGKGVVIAAGAVINPKVQIGDNVIVNTCASIDHECVISDGAHICPGVHLAGKVTVGKGTWIGIGSTVKERVQIGEYSIVGAGSVVLKNIPANVTVYGNPAEIKKRLKKD